MALTIYGSGFDALRAVRAAHPDASTGKCPTTGYFNERREDHEIDLPWEVSRPAYCVYNLW